MNWYLVSSFLCISKLIALSNSELLNRCGLSYEDAEANCATAALCPNGKDSECYVDGVPNGTTCFAEVPCDTIDVLNSCGLSYALALENCATATSCPLGLDSECYVNGVSNGETCFADIYCSTTTEESTPSPVPSQLTSSDSDSSTLNVGEILGIVASILTICGVAVGWKCNKERCCSYS